MSTTERTAKTVEARQARLDKTRQRNAAKLNKANDKVGRLEQQLAKLQAKLEDAKQSLKQEGQKADELVAKQSAALAKSQERHEQALERQRQKAQRDALSASRNAGKVESEDGRVHQIDRQACETIRGIIGRSKSGLLSPLDGAEAQAILSILDAQAGNVGETFEVHFRGRKASLLFTIKPSGLLFLTVNNVMAVPTAA